MRWRRIGWSALSRHRSGDLASLQTRAVEEGDYFIVNGQKVWTSGAHHADLCILLARTDARAPKHRGIAYLLVDIIARE